MVINYKTSLGNLDLVDIVRTSLNQCIFQHSLTYFFWWRMLVEVANNVVFSNIHCFLQTCTPHQGGIPFLSWNPLCDSMECMQYHLWHPLPHDHLENKNFGSIQWANDLMVWWRDLHCILHVLNKRCPSQHVQVNIWQNIVTLLHRHNRPLHIQPSHNPHNHILLTKKMQILDLDHILQIWNLLVGIQKCRFM